MIKEIFCFCLVLSIHWCIHAFNVDSGYKISWCGAEISNQTEGSYEDFRTSIQSRSTLIMPKNLTQNSCEVGKSQIWWFDDISFRQVNISKLLRHVVNGGVFIVEGAKDEFEKLEAMNNESNGLIWESPSKSGMFYRSFYLLQTLDGCHPDSSRVYMIKKKINAQAPIGIILKTHFLTQENDCLSDNYDYKVRSLMNILFAFMTTDYKEDQRDLPEILNRIRNLELEP